MSSPPVASIRHHLEAFRRHRVKAIAFFLLVTGLATLALMIWPGSFESESVLYVRIGRESVSVDPTATTGQMMSITDSREYEINSVAEVLQNQGLGNVVVQSIGVDRLLYDEQALKETFADRGLLGGVKWNVARWLKWLRRSGPGTEDERARKVVMSGVRVNAVPDSSIISVRSSAESPELARDLNQALISGYLDQHLAMHQSQGSEDFFREQSELLHKQLTETETELKDLKSSWGILSIDGKQTQLQQQIDQVEQSRYRVAAELAAADAHVRSLNELLEKVPDRVTTLETKGLPNLARDNMREELYRLEIELQDLLSRKTEAHPDVISTRKKIAEAWVILEASPDERSQAATDVNETHQSLTYDLMRQQALQASLQQQLSELESQRAEISRQFDDLNQQHLRVQELERSAGLLSASYRTYVEKLEQARITAELQNDRISNVHVVQPPSISSRPSSPNKPLLLVAAMLLAAIGSYLIVAISDALDEQLHSPEDVESELGVPVFATLPRTSRRMASLN